MKCDLHLYSVNVMFELKYSTVNNFLFCIFMQDLVPSLTPPG